MLRPQPTPSMAQSVAARVRGLIHAGDLSAGDRLPSERDLAAQLAVARVTVREAIRLLGEGGYLTSRRGAGGGTFVARLEEPYEEWLRQMRTRAGELDAILDFRIAVEGQAAVLAAGRRNDHELELLQAAIDDMTRASSRTSFRAADARFHAGVAAAARSARLEQAIADGRGEFFVPTDSLAFQERIGASVRGHQVVLQALRRQDEAAARMAMADHIEDTRLHLRRVLDKEPAVG